MSVNFAKLADYLNRTHLRGQPLLDAEMVSNASLAAGYVDGTPMLQAMTDAHTAAVVDGAAQQQRADAAEKRAGTAETRLAALETAIRKAGVAIVQADKDA